jgi:nucleoside-diphosphate-sugar epimerase
MKKVLVTGATGFIGRYSLDILLSDGFEVHAITRLAKSSLNKEIIWHELDLFDEIAVSELMQRIKPTHLIHFAWFAVPNKYWTSKINLDFTRASLYLAEQFVVNGGVRFVGAGTCAEYDWNNSLLEESNTPLIPRTLYGVCKNSLQMIMSKYFNDMGISFAWGRIFFTFGPYEDSNRLIPSIINNLRDNNSAICRNGNFVRDFMYVEDVASAFVSLLSSNVLGAINICTNRPIKIKDILNEIALEMGKINFLIFEENINLNEPIELVGNNFRLLNELNWTPKYTTSEALKKTINWHIKKNI